MSHDAIPEKTKAELEAEDKAMVSEHNAKLKYPHIRVYQRRISDGKILKEFMGVQCDTNWRKTVETITGPGWSNMTKIAFKRFEKARTDMSDGSYFDYRLIRKPEDVPEA